MAEKALCVLYVSVSKAKKEEYWLKFGDSWECEVMDDMGREKLGFQGICGLNIGGLMA